MSTGSLDSRWVVNARHIPAQGMTKARAAQGFIPDPQRELREWCVTARAWSRNGRERRIQKVLEGANIKLGSVATDVLGASGRKMLRALADGEDDPKVLADMAKGRLREKLEALEEALLGVVGSHQRFMLATVATPQHLGCRR